MRRVVPSVMLVASLTIASLADAEFPLLGEGHRGGHLWSRFCEGKPDDAVLPEDPRSRIVPGVHAGKAVYFNAYFEECHANLPEDFNRHPATCGEFRERRDRGRAWMLGDTSAGSGATSFQNSWQKWGFDERPANFDELYRLRYGRNVAPYDNPYPLPGEDPNVPNAEGKLGGSGQLPVGMRQPKGADGKYTGRIATNLCSICHMGTIGGPGDEAVGLDVADFDLIGLGNANHDSVMAAHDASVIPGPVAVAPDPAGLVTGLGIEQRGTNNADFIFQLNFYAFDYDSLDPNPNPAKVIPTYPASGIQNTPTWWNFGHRTRQFYDAGVSIDATRFLAFSVAAFNPQGAAARAMVDGLDQDLEAFVVSINSPRYPGPINTQLAEQGAVLFHEKDLFVGLPADERALGGNGSCSSCHGAYSPRYVNDPAWLEDPAFEGIAAHIVPLEVIGTDPARSDYATPGFRDAYSTSWWSFPENHDPAWVAPEDKDPFTELADDTFPARPEGACTFERGVIGYQAPPLYGVWASAPYFHNGAVPTVEQVLDSSKRPQIWRRQLQTVDGITGFDQRIATAYDFRALGWKHDALRCDEVGSTPEYECNPVNAEGPSIAQIVQRLLETNFNWSAAITWPDPTPESIEKRFIHDTRKFGNSRMGHDFADGLTDGEREAIIEYLKTL